MLYTKYRPKTFSEFIGQKPIVLSLRNAILQDKISHAYLFSGPRGTGKTTLARIFAKAVNCLNLKENADPCNLCENCKGINEGNFFDYVEIDAASARGIDNIKEIIEAVKLRPIKGKKKVFVVDECHSLTKEASNAFLKTLEEPPEHIVFILATTEPEKVLPTIISRTQRFQFRYLTSQEIFEKLKFICESEKIQITDDALRFLSFQANGSLRDAETILEKVINAYGKEITRDDLEVFFGTVRKEIIFDFFQALRDKNKKNLLEIVNNIFFEGYDVNLFLEEIIKFLRGVSFIKVNPALKNIVIKDFLQEDFEKVLEIMKEVSLQDLNQYLSLFLNAYWQIKKEPPILILPIEIAILKI